jgi:hypothetical protein
MVHLRRIRHHATAQMVHTIASFNDHKDNM